MIKGIGVDIVEIDRINQAIENRKDRFIKRIFTDSEQEYCLGKPRPFRHFATRFAAKEAVSKALGTGKKGMRWTDVEVCRDGKGCPYIKLTGGAAERAREKGVCDVAISLSFNHNNAVASAVAMGS
ncbi:MAG: holo-ACP synthase [Actinomycetota bacterium]|nr:holo-ACP synthase [Actinomycetota bacterium]